MKKNQNLKLFYNQIYRKGEEKHFTSFVIESKPTSEIKEVLKQVSWKSKKVLDVGCGTGLFALHAAKKGASVLGIDFSNEAIDIAKKRRIHPKLNFQNIDAKNITEKYDIIVSIGTLEHMDNPLLILKLLKKHLNPNGHIIVTSPNWTNPRGYMLLTLWFLFEAPITLADLHHLTPIDFENFAKKLNMQIAWRTFDKSWAHGTKLIEDFKRRIPNVLHEAKLPNNVNNIQNYLKWIEQHIVSLNHDLPHSGALAIYDFSVKRSK
jgi:2-polyprenyl-3-methyl-5-hydroxy-6-metoxy-1,4-benzoquinol methylase